MSTFLLCANKDRLEYIRSRKNIICLLVLVCCAAMVLLSTAYMPLLLSRAVEVTNIMSPDMSIPAFMEKFFPHDMKRSLGIFSSDIGIFYSLAVIFMTFSLLPTEISTGRMILPLCAGYSKNVLFLSKQLVYSLLCAFPVFPVYMLYYFIGTGFLELNYPFGSVLTNALIWVFTEFSIVYLTIALSVIYKHRFLSLVTMAAGIMVLPDMLSFFSFGKVLPTHILTYLYLSDRNIGSLTIPAFFLIAIMVLVDALILRNNFSVDVDERR